MACKMSEQDQSIVWGYGWNLLKQQCYLMGCDFSLTVIHGATQKLRIDMLLAPNVTRTNDVRCIYNQFMMLAYILRCNGFTGFEIVPRKPTRISQCYLK